MHIMFLLLFNCRLFLLPINDMPAYFRLILDTILGALFYLGALRFCFPANFHECQAIIPKLRGKK